ncbi:response regulator transcription factor [Kitasatospora sp. NPDC008050]|uniref:helix-turn-helix transcriptional regulator n=1 Tax=Kitasatospora sp. NPDC008050 TaxID=3364021 RepID=UPI0036E395E2
MYQIAVSHEHPLIEWAVSRALTEAPDMRVHQLHAGPPGAAGADGHLPARFDVLVTDQVPERSPVTAAAAARASCVLVLAAAAPTQAQPGVSGYLLDRAEPGTLAAAVHAAASRSRVRPLPNRCAAGAGRQAAVPGAAAELSAREQQVLRLLADGFTHDQAARRMGVSRHTVDTYVKRARAKLGLGNKADLVRAAMAYGWAS